MKNWFLEFENCLNGEKASSDLIGAGSADRDRAMAHYRYQHQAKMKEAVEATFPVLLRCIDHDWQETWDRFWEQNEISTRNLDWFPEVFLNYFMKSVSPSWMKELARFEHHMDIHPWTNKILTLKPSLVPGENSRVILGNHELISFKAPVTKLYDEDESVDREIPETVILWQKEDGVYYRALSDWELKVFSALPLGVSEALELAPEDPAAVGEFFLWLGSSCLIQDLQEV